MPTTGLFNVNASGGAEEARAAEVEDPAVGRIHPVRGVHRRGRRRRRRGWAGEAGGAGEGVGPDRSTAQGGVRHRPRGSGSGSPLPPTSSLLGPWHPWGGIERRRGSTPFDDPEESAGVDRGGVPRCHRRPATARSDRGWSGRPRTPSLAGDVDDLTRALYVPAVDVGAPGTWRDAVSWPPMPPSDRLAEQVPRSGTCRPGRPLPFGQQRGGEGSEIPVVRVVVRPVARGEEAVSSAELGRQLERRNRCRRRGSADDPLPVERPRYRPPRRPRARLLPFTLPPGVPIGGGARGCRTAWAEPPPSGTENDPAVGRAHSRLGSPRIRR